jgi:hypothetical protein
MANYGKAKPRAAYVLQRRQMYAFDDQFRDAILRAYRNETRPLRDHLLSNPALSEEHCVMLAGNGTAIPRDPWPILPGRANPNAKSTHYGQPKDLRKLHDHALPSHN